MVKERLYIVAAPYRNDRGEINTSIHSVRADDSLNAFNKWKNERPDFCPNICGRVSVYEANSGRVDGERYFYNLIKEENEGAITYRGSKA